ncbi:hypothetical protein [Mycobacteroides abscessus]
MKLEPTEAQRKAMAEATEAWNWYSCGPERRLDMVDDMIAAANSIPEGAPVGTIARAPDGHNIAVRKQFSDGVHWAYLYDSDVDIFGYKVADSWPVIYDPTGKTLDELHAEIDRLDKAEDNALRERDYWEETVNRILYTCSSEDEIGEWSSANDPVERFIEQFKPVKRIDPTAQQEPEPEWVNSLQDIFDVRGGKPARTPRVVDRLGVDEKGSRWQDVFGLVWSFKNGWWKTVDGGLDYGCVDPSIRGPFKEILEPRVLPSLDCEEARDGTVWADSDTNIPFRYRFHNGEWERFSVNGHCAWVRLGNLRNLKVCGPYVEVLS